uniref:Uncharacterized protein n=1 Tax=viral metagenome TaxID=1070528 RepID=A0A6M3JJF5_9ZZZZ
MTQKHQRTITVKGKIYTATDVGCPDFDRAKENREIVCQSLYSTFYDRVHNWISHTSVHLPFPSWLPMGYVPNVGNKDWKNFGGEQGGMHEEE